MSKEQKEHRERVETRAPTWAEAPKMSRRKELWKKGIKLPSLQQERRKKWDKMRLERQLLQGSWLAPGSLGEEVHKIRPVLLRDDTN